jgi:hypothetical protein
MHLDSRAPTVREFRADVPEPLATVVDRALAGPRERRWQTAHEMRQALEPSGDNLPSAG